VTAVSDSAVRQLSWAVKVDIGVVHVGTALRTAGAGPQ
jgi:hypothetical protein